MSLALYAILRRRCIKVKARCLLDQTNNDLGGLRIKHTCLVIHNKNKELQPTNNN